ncbi:MAG: MFS transporter [Actinobacteria bacterium]|nr:MFS transporter [Actinomycetota bacterium]MBW3658531.1 MFS transporter [Actinomycetota bacterium]
MRSLVPLFAASAVITLGEGSIQVVLGPYLELRGLSAALIGTVTMTYGVAALAARLGSGALYRSARAPWLVAGGCVSMAIAFALLTTTGSPLLIAVLLGVDGAGYGVATTAGMAAVLERYPRNANAGSVMGWYTGATGAGYAVAGFAGGPLADALGIVPAILIIAAAPAVAGVLLLGILRGTAPVVAGDRSNDVSVTAAFRAVTPTVWLAFAVAFYVALVNGGLLTFFPIHALAIGLSLTAVGTLFGVHGAAATVVRFLSGPLFRFVDYRRSLPWMVAINAAAVISLSLTGRWVLLAVAWGTIGLTRGVLRVASSALVMDDTADAGDQARGAASTVYLAGLDVGKILGPPIAGGTAQLLGLGPMFAVIGAAFGAIYLVTAVLVRRRQRADPPVPLEGSMV